MDENQSNPIVEKSQNAVRSVIQRIKLLYYLLEDRRVSFPLKLIPLASIAYFLIPDIFPGPIDDATVIWLATTLFIELCPDNIVYEHMLRLGLVEPDMHVQYSPVEVPHPQSDSEEVIEGQFRIIEEEGEESE